MANKHVCACSVTQVYLTLCDPLDCIAYQAPLTTEFTGLEYCSEVPFPTPGDLSNLGIKPISLASPALQIFFTTGTHGKPPVNMTDAQLHQSPRNCKLKSQCDPTHIPGCLKWKDRKGQVEVPEFSYTVGGQENQYSHFGNLSGSTYLN